MTPHSEPHTFHITLFGATTDVPNLGCRALTASLVRLINEVQPEARISLLFGNRTNGSREIRISNDKVVNVSVVNSRLSPRANIYEHFFTIFIAALALRLVSVPSFRKWLCKRIPWLAGLERSDFVGDVFAGDSFSDIYGFKRLATNAFGSVIAILMRKQFVLLPQTYGPYNSWISRALARFIFSHASLIYARDKESIKVVHYLSGKNTNNKKVQFCPDVAFILPVIEPPVIDYKPPTSKKSDHPLIGININGLLYVGGYTHNNMFGLSVDYKKFIEDLVKYLFDKTEAEVALIPHEGLTSLYEGDRSACEKVFKQLSGHYCDRLHILRSQHDPHEVKYIIGNCDFFIGSRLHACIAALSQGVPTVSLAYSRKFQGVFNTLGVGDMALDARELPAERLLEKCIQLFEERERIRIHLKEVLPSVQAQVRACFVQMLGGAVSTPALEPSSFFSNKAKFAAADPQESSVAAAIEKMQ